MFSSTPRGIHRSNTLLNKRNDGYRPSRAAGAPDVVLFVIDATFSRSATKTCRPWISRRRSMRRVIRGARTKRTGWTRSRKILDLIEKYRALHDFAAYIPISAKTGDGLDVLQQEIIQRLPFGPAQYPDDYLTDQPQRFLAAEVLREKVLHHTQQEVPHAVAVLIDSWEDTPKLLQASPPRFTILERRWGRRRFLSARAARRSRRSARLHAKSSNTCSTAKSFCRPSSKFAPDGVRTPNSRRGLTGAEVAVIYRIGKVNLWRPSLACF